VPRWCHGPWRDESLALNSSKLLQLEGLRGLAAAMVVAWHFVWAFAPWELGSVAGSPVQGLVGSPVAAGIDGPAAVALFFVLSGFVIPLRFFHCGRARTVLHAAAKRWPRLAGLSVIAVLFSYALFRCGLFRYREAAMLTGSDWLSAYGGGDSGGTLSLSLAGAIREGLVGAFVDKSDAYNPVLWTMRDELLGSFLSMGVALAIRRVSVKVSGVILVFVAALAGAADPWLVPFVAGTGLALLIWSRRTKLSWLWAATSIGGGIFLFGYLEPAGAYSAIPIIQDGAGYRYDRILAHTVAGVLMMFGIVGNHGAGRMLNVRPLLLLGRLSFPIYLLHFPLLCSLGCGLFLALRGSTPYGYRIALVAIIYASAVLMTGVLLARVDEAWGAWLTRIIDSLLTLGARVPTSFRSDGGTLRPSGETEITNLRQSIGSGANREYERGRP
jgi:peptidoglycan/LPS O-acetylase OafA/YrhL